MITPIWKKSNKEYGEKEVMDFNVIVELKEYGLSLKEIQIIFKLKRAFQCGDKELVSQVFEKLTEHLDILRREEEALHKRRISLENQINEIKELL